ncbi:hypothetical protein, partial [Bradyrhizobium sp. RT3a]|uniref:hypothetical protein n=1 Tax=unclassified Bradyrhizobium TaxID=2631580 RepID=UPI00339AB527
SSSKSIKKIRGCLSAGHQNNPIRSRPTPDAYAELTRSWPLASRVAIDNTDPAARFLDKTVMLGLDGGLRPQKVIE